MQASFSYGPVGVEISGGSSYSSKVQTQSQMVTATMKIERYYSSVKEEVTPLSDDAFTLLEREDYVGFFKACGPNYVRSIRRAQEVTAMFKFTSTSSETAKSFSLGLKVASTNFRVEGEFTASSKFSSESSSLQIKIIGFGMGLSQEGSETMVATSIDESKEVMIFAFKTMTQNEDSYNIGMVYGMEVVPWVNNVAFQAAAKLDDVVIEIPVPRSLIQSAYVQQNSAQTTVWSETNREHFKCSAINYVIDRFGNCCEPLQLYHPTSRGYPGTSEDCPLDTCLCQPVFNLDKTLAKDNMANNAEFVARIDSAMRNRLAMLGTVEKCISAVKSIPEDLQYQILKPNDSTRDITFVNTISVAHLKKAVDPLGDYGLLKHLARELDEWMEMFYSPCLAALYGMNVGTTPDTEVSYFMAYPWYTYDECMKLTCVTDGFRWDRHTGLCTPSILKGVGVRGYTTDTDGTTALSDDYCAKDGNVIDSVNEVCKFPSDKLHQYHRSSTTCWEHLNITGIDFLIGQYCNPEMLKSALNDTEILEFETNSTTYCTCGGYNDAITTSCP